MKRQLSLEVQEEIKVHISKLTDEIIQSRNKLAKQNFNFDSCPTAKKLWDMGGDILPVIGNHLETIIRSKEERKKFIEECEEGWFLFFLKCEKRMGIRNEMHRYMEKKGLLSDIQRWIAFAVEFEKF